MILVTGGTGLLGSHLLYELVSSTKKVRVLYRNEESKKEVLKTFLFYSKNANELFSQLEWAKGDVLDIFSLTDAMQDVSHVYHCAAVVSFSPKDADMMTSINVD